MGEEAQQDGGTLIRCTTCGTYWKVSYLPKDVPLVRALFQCPNRHFSSFNHETGIIVTSAELIKEPVYIDAKLDWNDKLLDLELEFVRAQTAKLYDCGFFQLLLPPDKQPIPPIDLLKIERPSEKNRIRDEAGNIYRLVISPNGVTYYMWESKDEACPDNESLPTE